MSLASLLRRPLSCAALVTMAAIPSAASAQSRVGVLQCNLSGGVGLVIVENQSLDCVFQDDVGSPPVHYTGSLTNVGANIGVSGPGQLVWVVAAATNVVGPGALAGDYIGPQGSVAVGIGPGGAVLVGGSNNTFSLQPVSLQVGTGLSVSAGIGNLSLQYVPDAPPPPYHPPRHVRAVKGKPPQHPQILPPNAD